jgi:nicotinate phosphoribosyltransferase
VLSDPAHSTVPPTPLVDLYELTMGESYLAEGLADRPATFQVSCRTLPSGWGYLIAAGIEELIDTLESFLFPEPVVAFLESTGLFSGEFLRRLGRLRFSGEVRALPEGTVFFAGEPMLEVTAPLLEAQLVETAVLNTVTFPTLVTAKAARCVEAAAGRPLVDFSLRRTQGADAGLRASRGSYIAGFESTSNLAAGLRYGIPVSGTMAHSYVESFADEAAAFAAFTRAYPEGTTLLIDTYDTLEGARRAVAVARELSASGGHLRGLRLDSGDLVDLSTRVRALLDQEGMPELGIVVSGNLDEHEIARLVASGAPIDGFGVGTRMGVSADAPALDTAYKLAAFDGRPVMKLSSGKQTLPGAKQIWRRLDGGRFAGDVVSLVEESGPPASRPLLRPVVSGGVRVATVTLSEARERARSEREALPPGVRRLMATTYPVETSSELDALGARLAAALTARGGSAEAV